MVLRCWQLKGISSNLGVIFQLTLSLRPGAGLVVHLADFDENWVSSIVFVDLPERHFRFAWRVLLHEVFLAFFSQIVIRKHIEQRPRCSKVEIG